MSRLIVVNEMPGNMREITQSEKYLVEKMVNRLEFVNVDFIITKLVINNWPKNHKKAANKIKYDGFCYHYAMGFCQYKAEECEKYSRNHSNLFNIENLYNNGKSSIENKRKAYYLAYYLGRYCGYSKSSELNNFMNKIRKDKDFKKLLIRYKQKWANDIVNDMKSNVKAKNDEINKALAQEEQESVQSVQSGYTYTTNATNNTNSTFSTYGW